MVGGLRALKASAGARSFFKQSGLAKLHKAPRVYHWQCVNQRGGWKDSSVRGGVCDPDTGLGGCFVEALLTLRQPTRRQRRGRKCHWGCHGGLATWVALFSRASAAESFRPVVEAGLLQASSAPAQHEALERRGDSPRRGAVVGRGLHSL